MKISDLVYRLRNRYLFFWKKVNDMDFRIEKWEMKKIIGVLLAKEYNKSKIIDECNFLKDQLNKTIWNGYLILIINYLIKLS